MHATTDRSVLVPGDVVRAAAVVSLVVGTAALGAVAGALFLLVLGGVVVPRALGLPAVLDVAYGTSLLVAAWAAQLGWYDAVPWLDLVVHGVCTGLVAAVAHLALARWGLLADPGASADGRACRTSMRACCASSRSTCATCPEAWTPASVRPATTSRGCPPSTRARADSSVSCTVRSPGWRAQPRKCVPS